MDEAWNRWERPPEGRSDQDSDPTAPRLTRRSGSFREAPAAGGASRNRLAGPPREGRRPGRGGPEPLELRLDRWVSRGRELVDGVAGARPGSRMAGPEGAGLGHRGLGGSGINPARLGRWVEERLDWLLDDDGDDDWREPWQEPPIRSEGRRPPLADQEAAESTGLSSVRRGQPPADPWRDSFGTAPPPPRPGDGLPPRPQAPEPAAARRGLEAISRRGPLAAGPLQPPPASREAGAPGAATDPEAWPDDAAFTLQRWQRPPRASGSAPAEPEPPAPSAAPGGRPLPRSSRRR